MNQTKAAYQTPTVKVIQFTTEDVLSSSGVGGDDNQGEWDPQPKRNLIVFPVELW